MIYNNGIRFECRQCGSCCVSSRSDMAVRLFLQDARALALAHNLPLKEFVQVFCDISRDIFHFTDSSITVPKIELKKKAKGACIFLENGLCRVYADRPLLCRIGPFSAGFMHSEKYFNIFKRMCKGMGQGPLHPAGVIEKRLSEEEAAERQWEKDLCDNNELKSIFTIFRAHDREFRIPMTHEEYLKSDSA